MPIVEPEDGPPRPPRPEPRRWAMVDAEGRIVSRHATERDAIAVCAAPFVRRAPPGPIPDDRPGWQWVDGRWVDTPAVEVASPVGGRRDIAADPPSDGQWVIAWDYKGRGNVGVWSAPKGGTPTLVWRGGTVPVTSGYQPGYLVQWAPLADFWPHINREAEAQHKGRPTTTRVELTPAQMRRLEAAGWTGGDEALAEWLTLAAERGPAWKRWAATHAPGATGGDADIREALGARLVNPWRDAKTDPPPKRQRVAMLWWVTDGPASFWLAEACKPSGTDPNEPPACWLPLPPGPTPTRDDALRLLDALRGMADGDALEAVEHLRRFVEAPDGQ